MLADEKARASGEEIAQAARDYIKAKRVHYGAVIRALELCFAGSPDAPTAPQTELAEALDAAERRLRALLPEVEGVDPVVVAARQLFACFAPGRVISISYSPDEPPEEIARKQKITTDWIEEHKAAWIALCKAAGDTVVVQDVPHFESGANV